ncbi:MAG TPA: TlpA disulfide reductase family protein [Haliangiales bacterium]|nr:TlpA disulfide reductase family protein [Haliangiales bacterium]
MEPRRIAGYAIVLILVGVLCVQYIRALEPAASEDRTGACRRLAPTLFNPKLGKLPASARTIDELKLGFSAQDYTGATVPLSAYRGRVVLVNFWQTNCAPCKVEMPSMESLLKQFRTDDFVIVTLASEASFDPVRAFFPQGTKLTVLLDPPDADNIVGKISRSWGTDKWPESYLVDRKGNVRYYVVNSRDWSSPDALECVRALVSE